MESSVHIFFSNKDTLGLSCGHGLTPHRSMKDAGWTVCNSIWIRNTLKLYLGSLMTYCFIFTKVFSVHLFSWKYIDFGLRSYSWATTAGEQYFTSGR